MADQKSGPRSASELVEQKLQALGKGSRGAAPAAEPEPAEPSGTGMPSGNELDMLRSIMFGSLQRDVDRRLREMNESIDALSEMVTERTDEVAHDTDARLTTVQKEVGERLESQVAQEAAARKQANDRMEQGFAELRAQLKAFADESRQRQDALRAEIVGLLKVLEESKISRAALGDMLVEMGQRLKK